MVPEVFEVDLAGAGQFLEVDLAAQVGQVGARVRSMLVARSPWRDHQEMVEAVISDAWPPAGVLGICPSSTP